MKISYSYPEKWVIEFQKKWDRVCKELKESGVDLSKIYLSPRTDSREK